MANDEQVELLQPDRYLESESHVPNATDQYGVVLTNGAANLSDGVQYATPLFREHRLGLEGDPEITQDEYYLTPGQREAGLEPEPGTSAVERGTTLPGEASAVTGFSNYAASGKDAGQRVPSNAPADEAPADEPAAEGEAEAQA